MKLIPIFCALAEVKILEGCEFDPLVNAGAYVRCYIPASDAQSAIELLAEQFRSMKIELVETEWCVDYENTDWDKPAEQFELELVAESRNSRSIIIGTFNTWGHNAPDAG